MCPLDFMAIHAIAVDIFYLKSLVFHSEELTFFALLEMSQYDVTPSIFGYSEE